MQGPICTSLMLFRDTQALWIKQLYHFPCQSCLKTSCYSGSDTRRSVLASSWLLLASLCFYIITVCSGISWYSTNPVGRMPIPWLVLHTHWEDLVSSGDVGDATIVVVSHSVIWMFTSQAELTVTFQWCVSAGPADGGKLDGLSGPYGAYAVSLWSLCVARQSLGCGRPPGETGTACWHWHGAKVQHATLRASLSLLIPCSNTTPLDRTKRRGT